MCSQDYAMTCIWLFPQMYSFFIKKQTHKKLHQKQHNESMGLWTDCFLGFFPFLRKFTDPWVSLIKLTELTHIYRKGTEQVREGFTSFLQISKHLIQLQWNTVKPQVIWMLKQNIPFRNFTAISLELPVMNVSGAVKLLQAQEHILA